MKPRAISFVCVLAVVMTAAISVPAVAAERPASTPAQLVETYSSLADAILATKKTEWNLVHAILASTYLHAQGTYAQANAKIESGNDASADIEQLAAFVSQIANEGDSSIAGIRKRLVEAGHHHHANAEQQGVYDEGFVIVTREAKKAFLDAAGKIGKLAKSPDAAKLDAEWKSVQNQFKGLHPGG